MLFLTDVDIRCSTSVLFTLHSCGWHPPPPHPEIWWEIFQARVSIPWIKRYFCLLKGTFGEFAILTECIYAFMQVPKILSPNEICVMLTILVSHSLKNKLRLEYSYQPHNQSDVNMFSLAIFCLLPINRNNFLLFASSFLFAYDTNTINIQNDFLIFRKNKYSAKLSYFALLCRYLPMFAWYASYHHCGNLPNVATFDCIVYTTWLHQRSHNQNVFWLISIYLT